MNPPSTMDSPEGPSPPPGLLEACQQLLRVVANDPGLPYDAARQATQMPRGRFKTTLDWLASHGAVLVLKGGWARRLVPYVPGINHHGLQVIGLREPSRRRLHAWLQNEEGGAAFRARIVQYAQREWGWKPGATHYRLLYLVNHDLVERCDGVGHDRRQGLFRALPVADAVRRVLDQAEAATRSDEDVT